MSNSLEAKTHRQRIGRIGEDAVAERYAEMGFSVVARNLHLSHNEIDLILQSETHLVFVEVKLRKSDSFAEAKEFVDAGKQQRLIQTAAMYLSRYPEDQLTRFDVIEIYAPDGVKTKHPTINHLEDAFQ